MMGKYGWFIWSAYGLVLGGLAGLLWHSIKDAKQVRTICPPCKEKERY